MAVSDILLTQRTLAKRWRKSPRKIRIWTEAGILPYRRDPESGLIVYPLAAIERWEAEQIGVTDGASS